MQNPYIIRTAAIASLAAAVVAFGWMSAPEDELQISEIAVAPTLPGPAVYFPAQFVLQANEAEPEPYEYY
jgi:hypothetical protein